VKLDSPAHTVTRQAVRNSKSSGIVQAHVRVLVSTAKTRTDSPGEGQQPPRSPLSVFNTHIWFLVLEPSPRCSTRTLNLWYPPPPHQVVGILSLRSWHKSVGTSCPNPYPTNSRYPGRELFGFTGLARSKRPDVCGLTRHHASQDTLSVARLLDAQHPSRHLLSRNLDSMACVKWHFLF